MKLNEGDKIKTEFSFLGELSRCFQDVGREDAQLLRVSTNVSHWVALLSGILSTFK